MFLNSLYLFFSNVFLTSDLGMNKRNFKNKIPILRAQNITCPPIHQPLQAKKLAPLSSKPSQNQIAIKTNPPSPKSKLSNLPQFAVPQYSKYKNVRFCDLYGNYIESIKCNDLNQHQTHQHQEDFLQIDQQRSKMPHICHTHLAQVKTVQKNYRPASHLIKLENKCKNNVNYCEKCPICNDRFGTENIVVLSCGHTIHATCLMSFRRFSRQRVHKCPVCHQTYEFVTLKAEMEHYNRAALLIQSVFRGYIFRRRHMMNYVSPGSLIHRRWVFQRAEKASTRLASAIEDQSDAVDAILASIDKELDWARNVMSSVEIKEKKIDWETIKLKVLRRWKDSKSGIECPICLREIKKNECSITSCCHSFHTCCITSWMSYCKKAQNPVTCPVCRSVFQCCELCQPSMPKIENKNIFF